MYVYIAEVHELDAIIDVADVCIYCRSARTGCNNREYINVGGEN